MAAQIIDSPALRDRVAVFRDRAHAGELLAELLCERRGSGALVLAVPAGGVPVASVVAERLGLALDVAVVSKITLPWNTEVGYGAVAFDGGVLINDALVGEAQLSEEEVERGIESTRQKVARRISRFRGERPWPDLSARTVMLVDDGLASGFTMRVAVAALRSAAAARVLVAVPTGHLSSLERLMTLVDGLYCANVRGGWGFAVADAYRRWSDVEEDEVETVLRDSPGGGHG